MKKLLIAAVLLTALSANLFAGDYFDALATIKASKDPASLELALSGLSLTDMEKNTLLNQCEKQPWGPFALNFLLGLGIGSFVQGDSRTGWCALACELGSLALYCSSMGSDDPTSAVLASLTLLGIRIIECIAPFTYAKSYNNRLAMAISSAQNVKVAMLPGLADGKPAISMSASISY